MRATVIAACFVVGCSASEPDATRATPPPDLGDVGVAAPLTDSEPLPPPFEPELASTKPTTECLVTQKRGSSTTFLGPPSWSFAPACGPLIKLCPEIAGMPQ